MKEAIIQPLPLAYDLENKRVWKAANAANRQLAELKGIAQTIPNEAILLNTLILQEAKDSSAIENIITTHDEVFKANLFSELENLATKEVMNYGRALRTGFGLLREHGFLSTNHIIKIQAQLGVSSGGFRKLPNTKLTSSKTHEVIYVPPQHPDKIVELMSNLEKYINDSIEDDLDPLVKMAIIHHQFESIHPFPDGNGRTGRIINILYLTLKGLLDYPILYLSRYIIRTKTDYYRLLREVNESQNWEDWVLYMLKGVEETAKETIELIKTIRHLMQDYKTQLKSRHSRIYSKDLLENLFKHPYTKITYLESDLGTTYKTARKYLELLSEDGLLQKHRIKGNSYYINEPLLRLFL